MNEFIFIINWYPEIESGVKITLGVYYDFSRALDHYMSCDIYLDSGEVYLTSFPVFQETPVGSNLAKGVGNFKGYNNILTKKVSDDEFVLVKERDGKTDLIGSFNTLKEAYNKLKRCKMDWSDELKLFENGEEIYSRKSIIQRR